MKKTLACILSLIISVSLVTPAYAQAEQVTGASGLPSFFSLQDVSGKNLVTGRDLTQKTLIDGITSSGNVKITSEAFLPDALQETFLLANMYDIEEAVSFRMNDTATSSGTPCDRIKKAIYEHKTVLLDSTTLVIGYDDSYVKEDSVATSEPDVANSGLSEDSSGEKTGAYLVIRLNGMTDVSNEQPEYVLYDDTSIAASQVLVVTIPDTDEKGTVYKPNGGIGDGRLNPKEQGQAYGKSADSDDGFSMANVFTAQSDDALTSVTFYTSLESADYSIEIYTGLKNEDVPTEGNAAFEKAQTGTAAGAGLHKVTLDKSVKLNKDEKFSVCVHFTSDKEDLFYDVSQTGNDEKGNEIWSTQFTPESGQSFLSANGTDWIDFGVSGNGGFRVSAETDKTSSKTASANTQAPASQVLTTSLLENGAVYTICNKADSSYVLDAAGGGLSNGTNLQLYKSNGTAAQMWVAQTNGDGVYTFVSLRSGKVIDVVGNSSLNGTNIDLYTPNGTTAQKYRLVLNSNGSYSIQGVSSGKVIDIDSGRLTNSSNIQLYESNGTAAQQFTFQKVDQQTPVDSRLIRPACAPGHTLDVSGGSRQNMANIQIYTRNYTQAQTFAISQVSEGYYKIINAASGMALDVACAGSQDGTNVWQYSYNGSKAQLWRIVKNYGTQTYSIFSAVKSDMALTVAGGGSGNGTNVEINTYNGSGAQTFSLPDTELEDLGGTYTVRSSVNPDRVIDAKNGGTSSGTNVQTYDSNRSNAQKYIFTHVSGSTYTIKNAVSGLALDVDSARAADGSNVQLYAPNGTKAQQWVLKDNEDGSYTICSAINQNYVLDVYAGSNDYGANVQIWQSNNSAAQKWILAGQDITSCTLTSSTQVRASGTGSSCGEDGKVYLVGLPATSTSVSDAVKVASASGGDSFSLTGAFSRDSSGLLQDRFYTAIYNDGIMHLTSNGMYITNPEVCATNNTARVTGRNKKGLASSGWQNVDEAIALGANHIAENVDVNGLLTGEGYNYNYGGKTYSFSSAVISYYQQQVKKMTAAGVEVTCILYLVTDGSVFTYMTPGARHNGSAVISGFNTTEAEPRKKIEALFACLADVFSKPDCQVGNWVLGNEIDNPKDYNNCGPNLSIHQYTQLYTDSYRMCYNSMKSRWSNVRVYLSLDHVWNTESRGDKYYTSKGILDEFNSILDGEGNINWDLAFHAYCSPEQDCRFWNSAGISYSYDTAIITMKNIGVLVDYVQNRFGSSHRIILSENGFGSYFPGAGSYPAADTMNDQPAAIAYAYYIAECTNGIDNFIVHHLQDDSGEMAGGWYLGLKDINGSHKPSYNVFKDMDNSNWQSVTQPYLYRINGATSWWNLLGSAFHPDNFIHAR